jgi:hypothetical protein
MLAAFSGGFLLIGVGIGISIYRAWLPWFLSLLSIETLRGVIERTGGIYQARWRREKTRVNRFNFKATGRHLVGVPLQRSAVDEVNDEFKDVKPPNEARKL